jgi:hypothetical protein
MSSSLSLFLSALPCLLYVCVYKESTFSAKEAGRTLVRMR